MPLPSCYSAVCPLALWMNLGNKEICKFITDFKELVYLFPCSLSLLSFDDVIYSIHCFIMHDFPAIKLLLIFVWL